MRSHLLPGLLFVAATAACTVREAPPPARPVPSAEAHAMRDGFFFLGERGVDGAVDHDAIHVGKRDGQLHQLMVVVERAPVEIFDIVVTFGDGERWEPRTRLVFGANSTSRNIDLPGGGRFIKRVDFRYGNLVAGTRAKVELWGR